VIFDERQLCYEKKKKINFGFANGFLDKRTKMTLPDDLRT